MAFIISAGTKVMGFLSEGIISVSLQSQPQTQRLWSVGQEKPFAKFSLAQKSLSISIYSGQDITYECDASKLCEDKGGQGFTIQAGSCAGFQFYDTDSFYVVSYSYQKDVQGWGTETWQMVSAPTTEDGVVATMIRGIGEGQKAESGASAGIILENSFDQVGDSKLAYMEVTAGSPGIGQGANVVYGEVKMIGGGTGKLDGKMAQGQAQIPYTPLFIVQ